MAIRTALLNGNNISRDTDFSKYIESVSEPGVIEGLEVTASKVGIGKARVPCERTNGETIYALVYNSSEVTISGNGDVYIEVSQTYIDDGELANEDGTGIATIQVGTMPSKNALKLATITNGTVTDARNMIPKVGELNTQIESIFDSLEDLDERVEKLEEAGAIDHLEESGLVGELYTLNDTLFKQYTPALADSTLDCNVSDVAANTQIHIQRIGSGVASNQLKLKVKMVGSSTQNLKVEVRKGVQVTVTEGVEAYWYGDQVIASGSIPYSEISTDYAEKTITLDNEFGGNKGELLDIVVYMDTVNASNYYVLACDSTQYSEAFSYVSVNGSTRARSKLMPYLSSVGFVQAMLSKVKEVTPVTLYSTTTQLSGNSSSPTTLYEGTIAADSYLTYNGEIKSQGANNYNVYAKLKLFVNGVEQTDYTWSTSSTSWQTKSTVTGVLSQGSNIKVTISSDRSEMGYINNFYLKQHYINGVVGFTPKEKKSIGVFLTGIIFGKEDKHFKGGIITGESTSVITGAITLGNAVGFLEVNNNGKVVKIPYFY